VPLTISQFVQQQLDSQQLTVKEFATRSGLGLSHTYQLLRGERKRGVTGETMDAIARGLKMTPAEMAVLMGRGAVAVPDEIERIAIVRQISPEDWPAAKRMLLGLAAINTTSDPTANTPGRQLNARGSGQHPPLKSHKHELVLARMLAAWDSIVAMPARWLRPLPAPIAATA
jgi:transcriptional regulator with XRE-family HTH domain